MLFSGAPSFGRSPHGGLPCRRKGRRLPFHPVVKLKEPSGDLGPSGVAAGDPDDHLAHEHGAADVTEEPHADRFALGVDQACGNLAQLAVRGAGIRRADNGDASSLAPVIWPVSSTALDMGFAIPNHDYYSITISIKIQ